MKILAIDCAYNPGTKGKNKSNPAIAFLENDKLISSHYLELENTGSFSSVALYLIRMWLDQEIRKFKPDWVIIERPFNGFDSQTFLKLSCFFGVAREVAYSATGKEPFAKWMAASVRSVLGIKISYAPNASGKIAPLKTQLRWWINLNCFTPRENITDDELDAYLLGLAFWRKLQDATFDPLDQDTARQKKIKARKSYVPFVTLCAKGKAGVLELDDYVDKWHRRKLSDCELHEYLGLSKSEYAKWVKVCGGQFRADIFGSKISKLKARLDARKARKEARRK